jgi:RNA polymerase sigma-70 factor (ECF subfamily)
MAQNDLEQIIKGCRKGDEESFSRLIELYAKRCFGYFYRLTGNREISDDLLSELFVKLVENINSYRGGSFDGWIFTMASNVFHDHLRFKQRQKRLLEGLGQRVQLQQTQAENRSESEADALRKALVKLDSDIRELIIMRYYSQLSFKDISKLRREPIGTTLSKVHRGLKKLREIMG